MIQYASNGYSYINNLQVLIMHCRMKLANETELWFDELNCCVAVCQESEIPHKVIANIRYVSFHVAAVISRL